MRYINTRLLLLLLLLLQQRICHFGHALFMDDTTYPKLAFFGYVHGKRSYKKAKEEAGNHGEV